MNAHEVEAAVAGGLLGGAIAFIAWCLVVSRQLSRARVGPKGFGA